MTETGGAAQTEAATIADAVFARLRGDIIGGRFEPGEKLRLDRMRALYGAGISPVREALSRLAADGLVVLESQRGFRVRPASIEDLNDIAATRIRIETAALALAIERGDDAWEARVVSAHHVLAKLDPTRIAEPRRRAEWEVRHREFHASLIAACGSPWLLHFSGLLWDQFDRYRRLAKFSGRPQRRLAGHHLGLVESVKARRPREATQLLAEHIGETATGVARILADRIGAPRAGGRASRQAPKGR
jgi:GntR family transcriptional regulator, carbon starvation induced regulator